MISNARRAAARQAGRGVVRTGNSSRRIRQHGRVMSRLQGQQVSFYSTEKILELRTGLSGDKLPKTVYSPERETENCGVGLVASLKSVPSRRVVDDADEMLVRMSHRGGCGCDPASGDGAGKWFTLSVAL